MSLFPAYFGRRRTHDPDPPPEDPEPDESRDDVFNLIPPRAETLDKYQRPEPLEPIQALEPEKPAAPGRNIHPVSAMDLTRLSIDNDGRLYWDGKPVEVRRRIMLSRGQVAAGLLIGAFIVVGGIGAAINGSAVAYDWACRIGWTASHCAAPPAAPAPPTRHQIPE